MVLTLANFEKNISKKEVKEGKLLFDKNAVRELDETDKGNFVAYVDVLNESYDVNIVFTAKNITTHTCDCTNEYFFCEHKVAILMHLKNKGNTIKSTAVKKIKKNENAVATLIDEVEYSQVKNWLVQLFENNKDLLLHFKLAFYSNSEKKNPADLIKEADTIVKSIVKSKKNIEQSELKKIVELWAQLFKPSLEYIGKDLAKDDAKDLLKAIINMLIYYDEKFNCSTTKITNYGKKIFENISEIIIAEPNDEKFCIQIKCLVQILLLKQIKYHTVIWTLNAFQKIAEGTVDKNRKKAIGKYFKEFFELNGNLIAELKEKAFDILQACEQINENLSLFSMSYGYNKYNLKVINKLLETNNLLEAEMCCITCINNNYKDFYSIEYLDILYRIYSQNKDANKTKIINVLTSLVPLNFNYKQYKEVLDLQYSIDDAKKFRANMYNKVSRLYNEDVKAQTFFYSLLIEERKFEKIFEKLNSNSKYLPLLEIADKLIEVDKVNFLANILNNHEPYYNRESDETKKSMIAYLEINFRDAEIKQQILGRKIESYFSNSIRNYFMEKFEM